MASSFSANQYDSAFRAQRLQNWCEAKHFKERPSACLSHTTIADDRGHLLPGVKKGSAWPDFKGTWDLPTRIPARRINPTARSAEGLSRLRAWGIWPQQSAKSQRGGVGEQITEDIEEDGADLAAKTHSHPGTRNQNHRSQTSVIVSVEQHQASEKNRLINQTSAEEENPTSLSTNDKKNKKNPNGPETNGRPQSMTRSRQSHLQ